MKRLLNILKKILHPTVFTILVLVIIGFVVRYFGEKLGYGQIKPFGSESVRNWVSFIAWFVAAAWASWAIGSWLWQLFKNRNSKKEKVEPSRLELEGQAMRDIFERVTKIIRLKWHGKGRFKYAMPWYVVLGKKDAGKTSLIDNVGLRFPIDHEVETELREFKGFEAADFASWRISGNDAVLIDLQGEFFVPHEDRTDVQRRLWESFLVLLKKYRPRRPLNGIVLAIDAVEFFQMSLTEREDYALLVRRTISDLVDDLGTKLPVYVTFTKLDLVAGFNEYFNALKGEDRESLFGFHFEYRRNGKQDWLEQFSEQQEEFLGSLRSHVGDMLYNIRTVEARREAFTFYRTFFGIESPMRAFLEAALSSDKFSTPPEVRGIYFTSVRQENAPDNIFYQSVGERYGLPAPLYGTAQGRSHPFFVTRLFNKVIFPEASLAGANMRVEQLQRYRSLMAVLGSAGVIILTSLFWLRQYTTNLNKADFVETKVDDFMAANMSAIDGANQAEFLPPLNTIGEATLAFGNYREKNILTSLGSLYQGKRLGPITDKAYQSALNEVFVPSLVKDVETKLRNICPKGSDEELNLLRVYRMLGEIEGRENGNIQAYYRDVWQSQFEGNAETQDDLNAHLDYALAYSPQSYEIDTDLVIDSQRNLAGVLPFKRVYSSLRAKADRELVNPESFITAAGSSFDLVYTSVDKNESSTISTTDDGCGFVSADTRELPPFIIPEFYSKEAFFGFFLENNKELPRIAADDLWVLGALANAQYSEADYDMIEQNIREIYVDDYIQTWRDQLNGLQIHKFENIRDAIEVTKVLGSSDSPIRRIAQLVSDHTNIYENIDDADGNVEGVASQLPSDKNLVAGLEIKRSFREIQKMLVSTSDEIPTKVSTMIQANADLYEYLKQIQDDASPSQKALEVAIERAQLKGDDPIYVLKRIADKLPAPFNRQLNQVADDAWRVILDMAAVALNEKWQNEIYGDYERLIAGRFPFTVGSEDDLPLEDFEGFFSPEGILDKFYREELLVFVDETTGNPREIAGNALSVESEFIESIKKAQQITKNFFDDSGNLNLAFNVSPIAMSNNSLRATLNVEGQLVSYAHGPRGHTKLVWPNVADGVIGSRVDISPTSKNGRSFSVSSAGPWSLIRLIEQGSRVNVTNNSADISFAPSEGNWVVWRFRSESQVNLFLNSPLSNFSLPEKLNAKGRAVRNFEDIDLVS